MYKFIWSKREKLARVFIASTQLVPKACCWATGTADILWEKWKKKTSLPWHIVNMWFWGWCLVTAGCKVGGVGCALPPGTMMGGVGRRWRITECSAWTRMAGLNKKRTERLPAETEENWKGANERRGNGRGGKKNWTHWLKCYRKWRQRF